MPRDIIDSRSEEFVLSDVEIETLRRAATEKGLSFDASRRTYTKAELRRYGMVRESYTKEELRRLGFRQGAVSCFDAAAGEAEDLLRIDTPFGSGIRKWQLPVLSSHLKLAQTVFPPNTLVTPHMHPKDSGDDPGGGLRIVISGKLFYNGREYGPGDWFYSPNGQPYTFTTDPEGPTVVMYSYHFFGVKRENRFSHPVSAEQPSHSEHTYGQEEELALTEG